MLRGQQEELEHKEMREVLLQEEEEVEEVEEECMQRAAQARWRRSACSGGGGGVHAAGSSDHQGRGEAHLHMHTSRDDAINLQSAQECGGVSRSGGEGGPHVSGGGVSRSGEGGSRCGGALSPHLLPSPHASPLEPHAYPNTFLQTPAPPWPPPSFPACKATPTPIPAPQFNTRHYTTLSRSLETEAPPPSA
jgi:hypothetical protein